MRRLSRLSTVFIFSCLQHYTFTNITPKLLTDEALKEAGKSSAGRKLAGNNFAFIVKTAFTLMNGVTQMLTLNVATL